MSRKSQTSVCVDSSSRPTSWLSPLLYTAAALTSFAAFSLIGRASDSRDARVLGTLDPAFDIAKAGGLMSLKWLWGHPVAIGVTITGVSVALSAIGARFGWPRARPLLVLLTAFSLATWGQLVLWQKGLATAGVCLYLGGVLGAAFLGRFYPMTGLAGFPALRSPADSVPSSRGLRRDMPWTEWSVVFALTLLGLLFRGYALTEHPASFDGETTRTMVGSYTGFGVKYNLETEFLGTGVGIFHVLTHYVLYRLLGASIFTIRLVSLFWGVVAIPLLYWFARRIAGRGAAVVATVLFIAAPEQLFWSRNDNTFFAPVGVLALVIAHLGLSLQERFTPRAVLAAALGMPLTRYSYTPTWVLVGLPLLLATHAAVFVRGAFRRLRYAAPILLGGLLLWIFSLSVLEFSLEPGRGWRFIHPAKVKGEVAWRHNIPEDAGLLEVFRQQGLRFVKNAGEVAAGMTFHANYATHWYARFFVDSDRNTSISAGLAVLCALGIGYLLGQLQDRRAALLLLWIAIGLLPGCLTEEPEARRISVIFPALPIVAAVFITASVRLARQAAGRLGAGTMIAALGVAAGLTAFTSLASNLLLETAPLRLDGVRRFAGSVLKRCDLVVHNLVEGEDDVFQIASLDTLVRRNPGSCSQLVEEKDWPRAALLPRCGFTDPVFELNLSRAERDLRRRNHHPTRIGYLLRETPESLVHVELLRRLFPSAETREFPAPVPTEKLFALEVPLSAIESLRRPEMSVPRTEAAASAGTGLLEGSELAVSGHSSPGTTIRGGLLLPEKSWYRFRLEPPCSGAKLAAGTPLASSPEARPLLAGVHPFVIQFQQAADCRLPLKLRIENVRGSGEFVSPIFLSPRVVAASQAAPVVAVSGYGVSSLFARLADRPVDIGIDGKGEVFVLARSPEGWKVHRFSPDGREEAAFETELSRRESHAVLSVDAEGNCVLSCAFSVEVRDRSGRMLRSWKVPRDRPPSDAAFLPDGRIAFCFPNNGSVDVLSRDGRIEESFAPQGKRFAPAGLAVAPDGTMAVVEESGFAHVFRASSRPWAPVEIASFEVAYPEIPYEPDLAACAFDGHDKVLFPHRALAVPLIYDLQGRPVMASAPDHDLSAKGLTNACGLRATRDALYILNASPPLIIRVARP